MSLICEQVTKGKKWSDLGRILGYGGIPGLSTQIKNSYTRVILPYEQFSDRVRSKQSTPPHDPQLKTHTNIQSSSKVTSAPTSTMDDMSPPSSPLTTASSPLSDAPDGAESKDANGKIRHRRSTRMGSQEHTTRKLTAKFHGWYSELNDYV